MPFVQRVVQPTYLSRSHGNRICDRPPRTIARTGAVSRQKSSQLCAKTTKVLVHSAANAEPPRPSVSSINAVAGAGAGAAVTSCNGEEDGSLVSPSSVVKSSTSCCCCRKQHCCNGNVGNNNNNNNINNSNHNNNNNYNNSTSTNGNSKNGHNKGIIGSCCNAKTNSLSSFSYSTADIDIDVVDDEVDSGGATTSGRHQRCRGVSLDSGERGREEKSDASKEFLTSRSGYGKDDDYCYSSCNGGSNSHRAHVADYDDEEDEDDDNDDDDGDEDTDADDIAAVTPTNVTGNELESISNITLSNALRQLASLVIIASDIFQNLNKELQNVGDRTRGIKVKIDALDKRVSQFDPKLVTVPESDLGTFAQRKTHHQCDKSFHKELFTRETRPSSVKVLYEEAAKISECRLQASRNDTVDSCTGAADELVCTPVFGKANRKMRTRIDAEIEIRLPAGIEDLRKWTSSEALGDVTVTPDCLNRVDASISTSIVIGDNGVLTPALSPSVLSADAVDAIYSINNSNDNLQIPNDVNKDVPLNHRLPSPEEQCKLLALKYPAEIISVDTSGKRFERMCLARKSTTGCALGMAEANNLNDDIQTVSRRSRSRKVRGKRRNTIAGIDQKEIQDAANGTDTNDSGKNNLTATEGYAAVTSNDNNDASDEENNKVGRSKSSDILKKESVALPYDKGKSTLTRLNSLKQWGRNRFKFITPGSKAAGKSPPKSATHNSSDSSASGGGGGGGSGSGSGVVSGSGSGDIDDECIVHELTKQKSELFEKEGRFSHERKPSYSSSEKSVSLASNAGKSQGTHKLVSLSSGAVKLRDTSSLNRQRRNGINGHNKDEPHSSSGNWSASSESGRTSIGSEITIQPKSSASNTSLNVSSFHPGSGPPSSIISRRRFLTTSASSSVTSDGTATPDLQVSEPYNDDETSSAYSCDTEGYYTSFHMDSGLRTLKEEEPMSPLQTSSTHPSNYSFGSVSNQTVLTAENEYELFGRGSTSTTTSSAGTVCTTLLVSEHGPDVPERISSLSKLNKGNNSASTSTLERSYSSSTVGSTLERTGTIKRNVLAMAKDDEKSTSTTDSSPASQESEFTFETRMAERSEQPLPPPSITNSEVEYSESSDLEGVERIERIKQKTAMTAKRIPSMCIITPTTSDDENISTVTSATDSDREYVVNYATPYATVDMLDTRKDYNLNHLKRTLQHPLHNMLDKLKVVLPSSKRKSPAKRNAEDDIYDTAGEYVTIADISNNNKHAKNPSAMKSGNLGIYYSNDIVRRNLDTVLSGNVKRETEYVSLNELPCNIRQASNIAHPFALAATVGTVDTEKINSQCAASERVEVTSAEVSVASPLVAGAENESTTTTAPSSLTVTASANTTAANRGARVKMNSQGKIIYDSDSLKRRKGAHTTFAPGPYVKETESALLLQLPNAAPPISESNIKVHSQAAANKSVLSLINGGGCANRKVTNVRPVVSHRPPVIVNMTTKCLDRPPPPPLPPAKAMMAPPMPSPSSSSTSSTLTSTSSASASASSSASSPSSTTSASTVLDEGYHRFSKIGTSMPREKTPAASMPSDNSGLTGAFDRNAPVYWTLQNRRQAKPSTTSSTAKDDLYATPISRANRNAVSKSNAELQRSTNISPIVPRTRGNIFTSTPTKVFHNSDSQLTVENGSVMQPSARSLQKNDDNSPERFNTCSDRIGTSKTSLMDFKKLLLAKSAKNTPVQKMSAVEILKMNKRDGEKTAPGSNGTDNKSNANAQSINSPMTLLDLSGSPKTFASRRMLRQGQFGSPSKSFAPKQRSAQWRMNSMRTDVMSTTIPEANSEEDHSNSSGGSNHSGSRPCSEAGDAFDRSELISEETFDLKKNIFLQTEENNFMKGELKIPFGRPNGPPVPKYIKSLSFNGKPLENSFNPSLLAHTNTANANQHYGANDLIIKSNNIASKIFTTSHTPNSAINKEANIFPALETAL